MKRVALWVSFLLMVGCAFKEPEKKPAPIQVETATAVIKWRTGGDENSAEEESRSVELESTDGVTYVAKSTAILPATVPDRIGVTFSSGAMADSNFEARSLRSTWSLADGSSAQWPLQVSVPGSSQSRLEVSGIRGALSDLEEGLVYLNLSAEASQRPIHVVIPIGTPPSKVEYGQISLAKYEKEFGNIPGNLKELRSFAKTLHLIQVVRVRSQSRSGITVDLPVQLEGELEARFQKVEVKNRVCGHTAPQTTWEETYAERLFILPIRDGMDQKFPEFLDEHLRTNVTKLSLAPGEVVVLGVYGEGTKVRELMAKPYVRPVFSEQRIVTGCKAQCGGMIPGTDQWIWAYFNKEAAFYWKERGWPGDSKICADRGQMDGGDSRLQDYANRCAEWDLAQGLETWDEKRFCRGEKPGNGYGRPVQEGWYVQQSFSTLQAGTQSDPIELKLEASATQAAFAYSGSVSAEVRVVPKFLQPRSAVFE